MKFHFGFFYTHFIVIYKVKIEPPQNTQKQSFNR